MNEEKVYTLAEESSFFSISNVPKLSLANELLFECEKYGRVTEIQKSKDFNFSEEFLVKAKSVKHARMIKKNMHKTSFFGFELLIRYHPEMESIEDTRKKLKFSIKTVKSVLKSFELPVVRRRI